MKRIVVLVLLSLSIDACTATLYITGKSGWFMTFMGFLPMLVFILLSPIENPVYHATILLVHFFLGQLISPLFAGFEDDLKTTAVKKR